VHGLGVGADVNAKCAAGRVDEGQPLLPKRRCIIRRTRTIALFTLAAGLSLGAGGASAQAVPTERVQQDPAVTGQLNQAWGQTASKTAKLDTPEGTNGGALGQHSRSTEAANLNGGFASDDNAFGITFNVKDADGNAGRQGVGNVSADAQGPHQTAPGDGGNGQHAINNGGTFASLLNPVSGEATPAAGGTAEDVSDQLTFEPSGALAR
jgi:hypothetical protein